CTNSANDGHQIRSFVTTDAQAWRQFANHGFDTGGKAHSAYCASAFVILTLCSSAGHSGVAPGTVSLSDLTKSVVPGSGSPFVVFSSGSSTPSTWTRTFP